MLFIVPYKSLSLNVRSRFDDLVAPDFDLNFALSIA